MFEVRKFVGATAAHVMIGLGLFLGVGCKSRHEPQGKVKFAAMSKDNIKLSLLNLWLKEPPLKVCISVNQGGTETSRLKIANNIRQSTMLALDAWKKVIKSYPDWPDAKPANLDFALGINNTFDELKDEEAKRNPGCSLEGKKLRIASAGDTKTFVENISGGKFTSFSVPVPNKLFIFPEDNETGGHTLNSKIIAHEIGHQLGLGDLDDSQMGDASFNQPRSSIMFSNSDHLLAGKDISMAQDDLLGIYGLLDQIFSKPFKCPKNYILETSDSPNPQAESFPNICRPKVFTSARILDCQGLRDLGVPVVFDGNDLNTHLCDLDVGKEFPIVKIDPEKGTQIRLPDGRCMKGNKTFTEVFVNELCIAKKSQGDLKIDLENIPKIIR